MERKRGTGKKIKWEEKYKGNLPLTTKGEYTPLISQVLVLKTQSCL